MQISIGSISRAWNIFNSARRDSHAAVSPRELFRVYWNRKRGFWRDFSSLSTTYCSWGGCRRRTHTNIYRRAVCKRVLVLKYPWPNCLPTLLFMYTCLCKADLSSLCFGRATSWELRREIELFALMEFNSLLETGRWGIGECNWNGECVCV